MPASVYQQALLYACGDLDAEDVGAFERRLAGDQEAREALVAAVSMVAPSMPLQPTGPNPAYRARVRRRLLEGSRPERSSSPWLHALGGAAAAVLVMLLINPLNFPKTAPPLPAAAKATPDANPTAATAESIYSEMSNVERVERIRDQKAIRRQRYEDIKLPHGFLEAPASTNRSGTM